MRTKPIKTTGIIVKKPVKINPGAGKEMGREDVFPAARSD
jgi:hypothetical protein